jgi:molybdopterin converting factor small subunit
MPVLKVGALMRYYVDNQPQVKVSGSTVLEALQDAVRQYPALKFHVFDSAGKLRRHINVFVNDRNVRELEGLGTRLGDEDRVVMLASISGG